MKPAIYSPEFLRLLRRRAFAQPYAYVIPGTNHLKKDWPERFSRRTIRDTNIKALRNTSYGWSW